MFFVPRINYWFAIPGTFFILINSVKQNFNLDFSALENPDIIDFDTFFNIDADTADFGT
jgi:hypothetical protein